MTKHYKWLVVPLLVFMAASAVALLLAGSAWSQETTQLDRALRQDGGTEAPRWLGEAGVVQERDQGEDSAFQYQYGDPDDPLAEAVVEPTDTDANGNVTEAVVAVAGCTVDEDASLIVADQDDDVGLITNNDGAQITADDEQVVIVGEDGVAMLVIQEGEPLEGDLVVLESTGFTCEASQETPEPTPTNPTDPEDSDEEQDDQDCPVPSEVNTTTGSGDEQSPVFDITGGSFRVTINVDPTSGDPSLAGVSVFVRTEDDEPVTRIAKEGGGTESSIVNSGEDSFFLDILAANANYEITVEDCTGDTGDDGGNDSNDGDADDDGVIDNTVPNKNLPNTGGFPLILAGGVALFSTFSILAAWRSGER